MRNKIRIHYWNPNGTNDAEIIVNGEVVELIEELTFGINIDCSYKNVPLKEVLKKIAVNPMSDGSSNIQKLKKYFPSIR